VTMTLRGRARRWLAALAALVASAALAALVAAGPSGGARAADKVAVVGVGTTFINLNPLTHIVSTMRVTNNLLFDGLTRFDDDTYQPKPDLAESWTGHQGVTP